MRIFSGRMPQGNALKPSKRPGRNSEAGQNRPEFDLCALRRGHRPGIQPHSHITDVKLGPKAFRLVAPWAKIVAPETI